MTRGERALPALVLLLLAACVPLLVLTDDPAAAYDGSLPLVAAACATVGIVVARHQPRNATGWLLIAEGLALLILLDAGLYSVLDYHVHHGRLPLGTAAVFLVDTIWALAIMLGPLAILLFPNGRIPSRRWALVLWAYVALGLVFLAGLFVSEAATIVGQRIGVDDTGAFALSPHLAGVAAELGRVSTVTGAALPLLVLIWLSWIARQAITFRTASGERRAQLKWLISGAAACVIGPLVLIFIGTDSSPVANAILRIAMITLAALPLSIGVGILKYRLYDIDRLISRTLSYAIVTSTLAAVFVVLVLLTTDVLPFSSPVGVAASTLVAAALFNPLRLRVQRLVDRRFNRAHYDAEATVAAFTMRLRDAVDLDTVRRELLQAVDHAVEPAHDSVWIRRPD